MAKRLIPVTSVKPFEKLTSSFKPASLKASAALILIEPTEHRVIMATKRKKIDFGGSTVFPGGLLSADADGKMVAFLRKYYSRHIKTHHINFDDLISRCTALRELFEETGVLLYRSATEIESDKNTRYPQQTRMHAFDDDDALCIEWRKKVLNDPFAFEQLYRAFGVVPDILSMVLWTRLQTPWSKTFARRWDTKFYLALIDKQHIHQDMIQPMGIEMNSIEWVRIDRYEQCHQLAFPPPTLMQLKELKIICHQENALLREYHTAHSARKVVAIRPKLAVCPVTKQAMLLWNRDYLYDALHMDGVECVRENEEQQRNLHRIVFAPKKQMNVIMSDSRMYAYDNDKYNSDSKL